jgi:uncharacterized protein YprB with RNaseH-like and TPR domain
MGVSVGTQNIKAPADKQSFPIEDVIDGYYKETPFGLIYIVETQFQLNHRQGSIEINFDSIPVLLSELAGDQRLSQFNNSDFIFVDTETSGLGGGIGTLAFLIGAGRFDKSCFNLSQFFLKEPIHEAAQLVALSEFVSSKQGLVTFNGKSFDIPILNSRYIFNNDLPPFKASAHIDILTLARRLWRDRLHSRKLIDLEQEILGFHRTHEDVPGWLVPSLYFDYLRSGDARPLSNVFYHNAMDIISMAALLNYITLLLSEPFRYSAENGLDLVAIGKLFQDCGDYDSAAEIYEKALEYKLPKYLRRKALSNWSFMEKRRENLQIAIELWKHAAADNELFAHIELAKYFEHRTKDYIEAIIWTQTAKKLVKSRQFSKVERHQLLPEIEHRLARLNRKNNQRNSTK